MDLDVAICLPREAETVALVRAVVSDTLVRFGVTTECVDDIRLALSEACANVIDHASRDDEYEVRLRADDRRCEISVTNTGDGFDAAALTDVMPGAGSVRGRGVLIMQSVMDHVDFRSQPEAGTVVHLVKNIDLMPDGPLWRLRQSRDRERPRSAHD